MPNLRATPINFIDEGTLTAAPAMVATLPVGNVQLVAHDRVAQSTSVADQVIQGNWAGDGRRVDSFFMFGHTGQGGNLRLQLFQYADWTSQVYDSGVLPIQPLITLDQLEWGYTPLGIASSDLLALEAPYYLYFPTTTCMSFTLTLSNCQSRYWQIDRLFMGKYIEAPFDPKFGMQVGWQSNDLQQRSKGRTLRTRVGSRWRELKADMFYATDVDRAAWRDFLGRISRSEDIALSIFPGMGGRQERDHVFNAQLSEHQPFAWNNVNFNQTVFTFVEV